jgi:hypothetical protein
MNAILFKRKVRFFSFLGFTVHLIILSFIYRDNKNDDFLIINFINKPETC